MGGRDTFHDSAQMAKFIRIIDNGKVLKIV